MLLTFYPYPYPCYALVTVLDATGRRGLCSPLIFIGMRRVAICEQIESLLIQKSSTKSLCSAKNMRSKTAVTEVTTPAQTSPASVPIAKAVEAVKTAAAPVCRQQTFDFDF